MRQRSTTEKTPATTFVVDDDAATLDSIAALVKEVSSNVVTFSHGESFLNAYDGSQSGCVVLDLRLSGCAGTDVLNELQCRGHDVDVIMISGHADVPSAVASMRAGACHFLEKPFEPSALRQQVSAALERSIARRANASQSQEVRRRLDSLTNGERRVLDMIVEGLGNKQIANNLDISLRTFHTRRTDLLRKLDASSRAELIRKTILHGN